MSCTTVVVGETSYGCPISQKARNSISVSKFVYNLRVRGQMAQRINVVLNQIPSESRDLVEFIFFCTIGFTASSLGLL